MFSDGFVIYHGYIALSSSVPGFKICCQCYRNRNWHSLVLESFHYLDKAFIYSCIVVISSALRFLINLVLALLVRLVKFSIVS